MKSVLKEIIIILLLCCAICLILGVVFYDYIPTNKVIPSTVEPYTTSNTIKEEINQEITEFQKQTIVMEIYTKKSKEEFYMFKKEKGITLVALVVTIVVLLILAGVSISLVLDQNGIINKAKGARTEYQNAANYEKDLLTDTNTAWIDNLTKD